MRQDGTAWQAHAPVRLIPTIETGREKSCSSSDLIALRTVLNAQYDDFFRGLVPIDRYKDETQT